jgi:hypothetical protein
MIQLQQRRSSRRWPHTALSAIRAAAAYWSDQGWLTADPT